MGELQKVFVVFDGPPSHESGRFVEVEDLNGRSVDGPGWHHRADGYWTLGPFTVDQIHPVESVVASVDDKGLLEHATWQTLAIRSLGDAASVPAEDAPHHVAVAQVYATLAEASATRHLAEVTHEWGRRKP